MFGVSIALLIASGIWDLWEDLEPVFWFCLFLSLACGLSSIIINKIEDN